MKYAVLLSTLSLALAGVALLQPEAGWAWIWSASSFGLVAAG